MKIGYAQEIITPGLDRPVYLAGFANNRLAETIHDDLYARALALQMESTTIVLTALDLIGFFRPDVYEVIARVQEKYAGVNLLIASTHTHHGPDTMGLWGPDLKTSGVDSHYMQGIKARIASAIQASLENLQPAQLKTTSIHVPGVAKNARNPEIVDDELTLAQFVSAQGLALASLFNFPCHPEVLWDHNPHITSDYVHFLRQEVERQTGTPCIFFSGALGGMMTPDVRGHSFAEAEQMGTRLARQGLEALQAAQPGPVGQLSLQKLEVRARLTNILYKIAFRRKILPDVRDPQGRVTTEVSLVKIGGLWFAGVPGEMLPKLGLQLKDWMKQSGARVAGVIGLADDELGYILPVEEFKYPLNPFRPGKHYEETNSIGREIAPRVMEGLRELLFAEG
jgi:hypothetical protein